MAGDFGSQRYAGFSGSGGLSISISPIKLASAKSNLPHLLAPPSELFQHQLTPTNQFVVCSPLVRSSNSNRIQYGEDAVLSTSTPADTDTGDDDDEDTSLLDSFEIEHNPIYGIKGVPNLPCGRIKTRKKFEPSLHYKVWEDITPPFETAKARYVSNSNMDMAVSPGRKALKQSPTNHKRDVKKLVHVKKVVSETKKRRANVAATKKKNHSSVSKVKGGPRPRVDTSITPTEVDVLFGRGARTTMHNIKFREEVGKYVNRYQLAPKSEKAHVSNDLINGVKGYGGRFLAKDSRGCWYEVDDTTARLKASQGKNSGV